MARENLPRFPAFVEQATRIAREKEQGRILAFDFYATEEDEPSFLIHEALADAPAFAEHLHNLGDLAAVAHELFDDNG